MNIERERIRKCVARLFDADACADEIVGYIERSAPALRYYVERKAAGRLSPGGAAFLDFLRSMPEPIFAHLLNRALTFFRRSAIVVVDPANQAMELAALALALWCDERGLNNFHGTDGEFYALTKRLARLVLLEEQQRDVARIRLNDYSALARATFGVPPRFSAVEWFTPN